MNTNPELFALLYKEKTTRDIIVAIPEYYASIRDIKRISLFDFEIGDPRIFKLTSKAFCTHRCEPVCTGVNLGSDHCHADSCCLSELSAPNKREG